jgi:hypothetical protein
MVAIGKIVAAETLDMDDQVFRYQNWTGQIHIPIDTPEWLSDNFPGMLDTLHAGALAMGYLSLSQRGRPITG